MEEGGNGIEDSGGEVNEASSEWQVENILGRDVPRPHSPRRLIGPSNRAHGPGGRN